MNGQSILQAKFNKGVIKEFSGLQAAEIQVRYVDSARSGRWINQDTVTREEV